MRVRTVVTISLLTVILLGLAASAPAVQTNVWTSNGPKGALVKALAVSATNIYAGTAGAGVYLSTDDGQTWVPKLTGLSSLNINALAFSPSNANTVLAGTQKGLYRSTTSGTSWTAVASIPANSVVTSVTFADATVVYATVWMAAFTEALTAVQPGARKTPDWPVMQSQRWQRQPRPSCTQL